MTLPKKSNQCPVKIDMECETLIKVATGFELETCHAAVGLN